MTLGVSSGTVVAGLQALLVVPRFPVGFAKALSVRV